MKHRPVLERYPRFVTREAYGSVADEIEGLLATLPGLLAIYRTGSVSAPGISDLDRIAVVERSARLSSIWRRLSEGARYVALHSPFLVDAETFTRHRWFATVEPLELVTGTAAEILEPPKPSAVRVITGVEGLVVSRLKLAKQLAIGRIKVRPLLCELHSVRHDLRLLGLSEQAAPRAWQLAAEIDSLRCDWWTIAEHERDRRVLDLVARGPQALDEALARHVRMSTERPTSASIRLDAEWRNVTLVSASNPTRNTSPSQLSRLIGPISRRAVELVWRQRRHELALPASVIATLSGALNDRDELMAERLRVVRSYSAFMEQQPEGWSSIGFARTFSTR